MANVDKAYGLLPVKGYGSAWNGETIECTALSTYNTALYVGDIVVAGGSGDTSGRPTIERGEGTEGTPSTSIYGVIVSFNASGPDNLNEVYGAASTTRIVNIVPALPGYFFRVNADEGINPDDISNHFDLNDGTTEDTPAGRSGFELDGDTGNTTGRQVKLVRFVNSPNNAISAAGTDATGIDCIVQIVESAWYSTPSGVS